MRITATQIERWAASPEARGLLPVLVRRLIRETAQTTALAIRGADSVNLPGWDGSVEAANGNPWVPVGQSRWEMSSARDVAGQARENLRKRTDATAKDQAAKCDFIFVSPRRWLGKQQWAAEVREPHWRAVRAYDADDLEAWLEAAPATALWFGEQLGIRGPGVESPDTYWETWRSQTKTRLTTEAISAGRDTCIDAFRELLSKSARLVVVEADSTEEAAAFACARLLADGSGETAAAVTDVDGWRYVDASPQLRIVVAATPQIAARRAPKEGTTIVVPVNIGDRPDYFSPLVEHAGVEQRVVLERPDSESFEKALIALGEDEADAARITRSTGRSWSVYRRARAANPSIGRPGWIKDPTAQCLTAVVLLGGWNEAKTGDVACVEAIIGKKYEDLERDLLKMSRVDDSPVLKIGTVWKAKAPLELLHLFAPSIARDELSRFFAGALAILAKPDPALELAPEKRWMASIYGKVREESGFVIASMVDSLAKLSVYAENNNDGRITPQVDQLVRTLLHGADAERWLSLSRSLRGLAEAAPEMFLRAVENSLQQPDAPVRRLFTENSGDSLFGRSWHVDLLWALETLAWSPKHLSRVADVLAQLAPSPLPRNLSNRPMETLASLFRPWWPQTTATAEQRLAALDRLIQKRNDAAWELLAVLIPKPYGVASANAKPHWRDDDAGAMGPNDMRFGQYLSEMGARIIAQAQRQPSRIATLVEALDSFEGEYREQIEQLVESASEFADEGREAVRSALRKYLSWHNSFNRGEGPTRATADRLRPRFDALQATDLVIRHAWLFQNGWVELPDGREDDFEKADQTREKMRAAALTEILGAAGWPGVEGLVRRAESPWLVGLQLGRSSIGDADLVAWARKRFADAGFAFHDSVLGGLIHSLPADRRAPFLAQACAGLEANQIAALTSASPCDRATWQFLEGQSVDAQQIYWKQVQPGMVIVNGVDLAYLVDRLVEAGRQRTAFLAIRIQFANIDPDRLSVLLEAIASGAEPEGPLPDGWQIGEAMKRIRSAPATSRRQAALLEFRYFSALEHIQDGIVNLYSEMVSDPSLFMDCVRLVYRAQSQPADAGDEADDGTRTAASLGWGVLHRGRGVPGQSEAGEVDKAKFDSWVAEVRRLAQEHDRGRPADVTIGEWFSRCPADKDGTWPCLAVRDLLDQPGSDDIRRGFHNGVMNNRGVHWRAMGAGGGQERDLASRYRTYASPLVATHPQTAALLEGIAKDYEVHGRWHDVDSALIREGAR
jgi:hypothetical protein